MSLSRLISLIDRKIICEVLGKFTYNAAMSQGLLFREKNAFAEKMPSNFFAQIPRLPGVYYYYDRNGTILYVGKAKDLRARIGSYRFTGPKDSRKLRRLVQSIYYVAWELCASEKEALLLENQEIATQKPPFNRANKAPEHYHYLHWKREEADVCFWFSKDLEPLAEGTFGAFKSKRRIAEILRASENVASFLDSQSGDFRVSESRYRERFRIRILKPSETIHQSLLEFLLGESEDFVEQGKLKVTLCLPNCGLSAFRVQEDLVLLEEAFEKIFQRWKKLRTQNQISENWMHKEKLNEYLLRSASLG